MSPRHVPAAACLILVSLLLTAAAPAVTAAPPGGPPPGSDEPGEPVYEATIRRTAFGIPHILADDYGGLGFGYGYAFAEDNVCTAADFYVTVNGERSKWFGPDGTWPFRGNGTVNRNLESDAYYKAVNDSGRIEELLAQAPPHGPRAEIREAVAGYVAGYNAYLEDVGGPDGVSDPRCAGEAWVRPIEEIDAYRRFYQLASLASTAVALDGIGGASPPHPDLTGGLTDLAAVTPGQQQAIEAFPERFHEALGIGSNAYGFGSGATASGHGLVLGNPHFPWRDGERLYQAHLTIPGTLDVQGASLYGVPVVLIGTTEGLAWSHTVSTAFRFTPFQLTLAPGSPTTYLVDGQPREMEERQVTVEVRQDDGSVGEVERSVWWTDYGPVLTEILGLPLFPWTPTTAFAMGDANDHLRYLNHFFEKNHAQSVRELHEIQTRNQGVPWVNTIAADRHGEAYYADISVVPNVPDDKAISCASPLGLATFEALRLPVLDGSRSACNWDDDPDAVAPGIFGPDNLPHLFRTDFVHNGNDSYWLTNPDEPLEGFATIIGDEGTERTLRTRIGLVMVEDRAAGSDDYADLHPDRWTREILQQATLNNRQYAGELVRDDLVGLCESLPATVSTSQGVVSTEGACEALAGWDVRDDLDSTGAILFRRFWRRLGGMGPVPWRNGFDEDDPVHTPNTLNTMDPRVATALGDAIADLDGAGIPLDAPLGDWQYVDRGNGREIPIHGGPGAVALFNAINVVWQGDPDAGPTGYPDVPHGTSFVMVATWQDEGCPVDAAAFVTYSQSEDVTSPHLSDQTARFSRKEWIPMRFCEQDILADPELSVTDVSSAPHPGRRPVNPPGQGRPR